MLSRMSIHHIVLSIHGCHHRPTVDQGGIQDMARRRGAVAAALASLALIVSVTGCGRADGSSDATSANTAGSAATARDLLPASVRDSGVLRVATAEGYPPMEMFKSGTQDLIGVDPDLAAAIAKQLGLKLQMTNAAFDGLIPGLQAQRWDLAMSSMSDTAERRQAVNFVDYFTAGGAVVVPKSNPGHIQSLADFCGKTVVLAKGSSNLAIGQEQNQKCSTKMNIIQSEDAPTGLLQLDSGRAVATIIDYPVAEQYAKQSPGKYTVLPQQYDAAPWGIAIDKKNGALTQAVQKALQELITDGGYTSILQKWGVTGSAVKSATVNGGS
jgi:polar amino acid transport system substrate-binding protein